MKKLTPAEKNAQCSKEIRATLVVALIIAAWHIITAFALSGNGKFILGIPSYAAVSCFGAFILTALGALFLLKKVFVDFDYEDENALEEGGKAHE